MGGESHSSEVGIFKGIKLLIPPESCREGERGIVFPSLPAFCFSLPRLEGVLSAIPSITVSFKGGGR